MINNSHTPTPTRTASGFALRAAMALQALRPVLADPNETPPMMIYAQYPTFDAAQVIEREVVAPLRGELVARLSDLHRLGELVQEADMTIAAARALLNNLGTSQQDQFAFVLQASIVAYRQKCCGTFELIPTTTSGAN